MERKIVSVSPSRTGWRIEVEDHVPQELPDMPEALEAAWRLARDLSRFSGCPTAVKVQMGWGDGVMIGYHP